MTAKMQDKQHELLHRNMRVDLSDMSVDLQRGTCRARSGKPLVSSAGVTIEYRQRLHAVPPDTPVGDGRRRARVNRQWSARGAKRVCALGHP